MEVYIQFWTLMILTSLAFTNCQDKVELPEQQCDPKPVVIPVDSPTYQYLPFHVQLYRCQGSCYVSPDTIGCVPQTTKALKVKVQPLNAQSSKYITMVNHTSCKCQCVKQDNQNCGPNSRWNDRSCSCDCLLNDRQCPEGFKFNKGQCNCICSRDKTPCFLSDGRLDVKKQWNDTDCGCVCLNKYFKRCSRKGKVLDESNCKCVEPPNAELRISNQGQSSTEKGLIVAIVVVGILCILVFVYDSYMYRKKIGVLFLCFGKKEQALYTPGSADEIDGKRVTQTGPATNGDVPNGQSKSETSVFI